MTETEELLKERLEAAEDYIKAVEEEARARKELLGLQPNGSISLYDASIEGYIARVTMARERWNKVKTRHEMASLPEL